MTFFQIIIALPVTFFLLITTFNSIVFSSQKRIFSILFFLLIFLFLFLAIRLMASLEWDGAEDLPLANFAFLSLDLSGLDFLVVKPWVCTLAKVFWDGQWPLKQQKFAFWTIILDFRLVLASALTAFYTIFLKLVNAWSYCSILTLIKDLKLFQK